MDWTPKAQGALVKPVCPLEIARAVVSTNIGTLSVVPSREKAWLLPSEKRLKQQSKGPRGPTFLLTRIQVWPGGGAGLYSQLLERLRQEDCKFKSCLGTLVRLCLRIKRTGLLLRGRWPLGWTPSFGEKKKMKTPLSKDFTQRALHRPWEQDIEVMTLKY